MADLKRSARFVVLCLSGLLCAGHTNGNNLNWVVLPAKAPAAASQDTTAASASGTDTTDASPAGGIAAQDPSSPSDPAPAIEPLIPPVETPVLSDPAENHADSAEIAAPTEMPGSVEPLQPLIDTDAGTPLDAWASAGAVLDDAASTPRALPESGNPDGSTDVGEDLTVPAEDEAFVRSLLESQTPADSLPEGAAAPVNFTRPAGDEGEAGNGDESREGREGGEGDAAITRTTAPAIIPPEPATTPALDISATGVPEAETYQPEAPDAALAPVIEVKIETDPVVLDSEPEAHSTPVADFTVGDWMLDPARDNPLVVPQAIDVALLPVGVPASDPDQLPAVPAPDGEHEGDRTTPADAGALAFGIIPAMPPVTAPPINPNVEVALQSGPDMAVEAVATVTTTTQDAGLAARAQANAPTSEAMAEIEAELNRTLVLGPVAIGDDLDTSPADNAGDDASDASATSLASTAISQIIEDNLDQLDAAEEARAGLPPPIPLVDILERALANNPEVAMALAREEQARWGVREAAAYRSPTLDLAVEGGPEYNRPATETSDIEDITPGRNLNIRLTQLLYDGGTSASEEQRRHQLRRTAEIETRLVIEDIVTKAIKSYMQILQNQQAARVADDFVAEMKRMVDQIAVMKDSGAASGIELDFARSRLASAIAQTGTTEAQLNDAVAALEFLTGDLPPFTAVTPMKAGEIQVDTLVNYSERARYGNAEVLLNASNKAALGLKLRGQQAQFKPILTLNMKSEALADEGGNLDPRNTTEAKLKVEYFILDGGVRKARIQRTKAQLVELDWDHERVVRDVDRRIKQSYNQITTNRLTLSATEDEVRANEELRRLNRENLKIGDISILELIEAEERLFNSRANRDRIAAEMLRNYYELLIGTGDLPQVLSEDYVASRIEPLED